MNASKSLACEQKEEFCTIVSAVSQNEVLIGSNLDAPNPNTKIWFIPPSDGQYGRVCFGFNYNIAENGMNEHGLFIDCNTVPETGWKPDPNKPHWEDWEGWYESGVPDGILAKCKTVDEAILIFRQYNLLTFRSIKYMVADTRGKSAVIEWSKKGLAIIERPKDTYYQISTNLKTIRKSPIFNSLERSFPRLLLTMILPLRFRLYMTSENRNFLYIFITILRRYRSSI